MKVLFIGDIVGKAGRNALKRHLAQARLTHNIDYCVANGENASHGFGLTIKCAEELFGAGVDLITGGNHIWDKKEVYTLLENRPVIRPLNYADGARGSGVWRTEVGGAKLAVINLIGFHNMGVVDNPFNAVLRTVDQLHNESYVHIAIDFHAETTSEKNALLKMLEGKISAIVGTHTHIGTDDLLIANGTGYVSDIGLSGIRNEVIGMNSYEPIMRFKTGMKMTLNVCEKGLTIFQAIVFEIDENGRCTDAYKIKAYDDQELHISMRSNGGWND